MDPAIPEALGRPLFIHNPPPNWLVEDRLRQTEGWGEGTFGVVQFEVTLSGRF